MFECVYKADMVEQQINLQNKAGPAGTLCAPTWTDRTDHNQRFYMVESYFNMQFSQGFKNTNNKL